jgi:hypothetical protein
MGATWRTGDVTPAGLEVVGVEVVDASVDVAALVSFQSAAIDGNCLRFERAAVNGLTNGEPDLASYFVLLSNPDLFSFASLEHAMALQCRP